jgi:glucokinase
MLTQGIDLTGEEPRIVFADADGRITSAAGAPDAACVAAFAESDATFAVPGLPRVGRCVPGQAAMAAEVWLGAARGARHAVCLHIGEQLFAGVLLNGVPWVGAHRRAGAAAWLALNPVERQDYRKLGSLAAEVSSKGIARRLSWRVQAGDRSRVVEAAGGVLDAITVQHVFDGARGGDGVAISVVRDTAKYIGMAIASLAAMLDPEVVVVGGEVAASDLMLEPVRQECARRLPPDAMTDLRVEFSTLGPDAVAIGAARLAMQPA